MVTLNDWFQNRMSKVCAARRWGRVRLIMSAYSEIFQP